MRRVLWGATVATAALAAAGWMNFSAKPAPQSATPGVLEQKLAGMKYRFVGPWRGGRVLTVGGVAGDANTWYLGAVDGGVWRTSDAGKSWTPLFDAEPVQSIGALEVAPSNPDIIYVGTGETDLRNDISYGDGMYKSTDAGKTWSHIGLPDSQHISRLAIDPKNPNRVFVAALGHASGPNAERGIFRTTNGGATWTKVLFHDDKSGGNDIVFDPADPNILYASLYEFIRKPWTAISGGPGSGLYKSTDGGTTWTNISRNPGLPAGVLGKINIAVAADSKTVYAQVEAKEGGLFVSKDAGATWTMANNDDAYRERAWYFNHIFADPKNVDTVYALNTGVFRSTDGGKTFRSIHGSDSHGLWIDPQDPTHMITSNDGGASVSLDNGASWSSEANQPLAQIYHVEADDQPDYEIYGEQQDAGSIDIPTRTTHNGILTTDWHGVGGGESGWAVPSPDGDFVYAGNYMTLTRWDRKTGATTNINPWPENSMGWGDATLEHRFQWTAPIAMSPFDSNTIYYGGEILYKSTDRGEHWTKISKDLTRNVKSTEGSSGGPITQDNTSAEYYATIFAIAESPKQRGVIWTGSDDGLVHITMNGGASWADVTPPELKEYPQKEWAKIGIIAPSPFDAGTAYVAARRNKMDDFAPYIYKTTDFGKTWTKTVSGIPVGSYVNSVKSDNVKRGLLFAGTELGIYVSQNDGASWQSLQLNLPHVSVRDITVHDNDLDVATHGRAFWVLDNISPLRDFAAATATGAAILFKPADAIRTRGGRGGFGGGGGGGRGGAAQAAPAEPVLSTPNPPAGPLFVDYWLAQKPQGPVTIDLLDASGKSVHTWTSTANVSSIAAPAPAPVPAGGRGARGGGRGGFGGAAAPPVNVPDQAGFNRFSAPLPNEAAAASSSSSACILTEAGKRETLWGGGGGRGGGGALPVGMYTVRLTVDGATYKQPLHITMDPSLHVTDAEMAEQYKMAATLQSQLTALQDAVNDMVSLKKQIAEVDQAHAGAIATSGAALTAKMQGVIDVMANLNSTAGEDPLNYAIGLDNKIGDFEGSVAGAEGAPNAGMIEVFDDLEPQYTAIMARYKALQPAIAAYNAALTAAGVKTVAPGPRPTEAQCNPGGGRGRGGEEN